MTDLLQREDAVTAFDEYFRGFKAEERRCYLPVETLRELVEDPTVLRALVEQLEVPGKSATLRELSDEERFCAVMEQIEGFTDRPTSVWYQVPTGEVLAASLYRGLISRDSPSWRKAGKLVRAAFAPVRMEADLNRAVIAWLRARDLDVRAEVPMGSRRADFAGLRVAKRLLGLMSELEVIAVENKNDLAQMKRGLDQLATFQDYSTCAYLACTPFLAAQFLDRHAEAPKVRHWDADVLRRRLGSIGAGLLIVEDDAVTEVMAPTRRKIEDRRVDDVYRAFDAGAKVPR